MDGRRIRGLGASTSSTWIRGRRLERRSYTASPATHIYKTTDTAETWVDVTAGLPGGYAYGTVGVCASDPDVAYVGSNENAGPTIYKTSDGGATWKLKLIDPSSGKLPVTTTVERDWVTMAPRLGLGRRGARHQRVGDGLAGSGVLPRTARTWQVERRRRYVVLREQRGKDARRQLVEKRWLRSDQRATDTRSTRATRRGITYLIRT